METIFLNLWKLLTILSPLVTEALKLRVHPSILSLLIFAVQLTFSLIESTVCRKTVTLGKTEKRPQGFKHSLLFLLCATRKTKKLKITFLCKDVKWMCYQNLHLDLFFLQIPARLTFCVWFTVGRVQLNRRMVLSHFCTNQEDLIIKLKKSPNVSRQNDPKIP